MADVSVNEQVKLNKPVVGLLERKLGKGRFGLPGNSKADFTKKRDLVERAMQSTAE